MTNKTSTIAVTRKEFYGALAVLWVYVSFAFKNFEPKPGTLQPWITYVLWGASLALGVGYAVLALRSRKTKHTEDVPD